MKKKHLKQWVVFVLGILTITFTGCSEQWVSSETQSFSASANAPFVVGDNNDTGSVAQSFEDEFSANGEREADYRVFPEQIVKAGETLSNIKITDFSSTQADTKSTAEVEIISAQIVPDISSLDKAGFINAEIVGADGKLSTQAAFEDEAKLAVIHMKISNNGDISADFVCDTRMYRVDANDSLVSFADNSMFLGAAYFIANPSQALYGAQIRLQAGETIEVSIGYIIPSSVITEDVILYYELNAHEDSFFYETGRKEVYFVEVSQ